MTRTAPARRSRWSVIRSWIRRVWVMLGVLVLLALGWSFQAHGVDPSILETDADVRVTRDDAFLEFAPRQANGPASLLFLPGAMVQPEAYAPMARAIAEAGFTVVIVKLPFLGRHAPTERYRREALDRAIRRMREPGPDPRWVVAGHSFGGVLISRLAAERPGLIRSLVLIATTHPRDVDLSGSGLDVLKILGTRDGVAPPGKARANAARLPAGTRWVEIEGANHAGFAYYGPQIGDGRAGISRQSQQHRLVELIVTELDRVSRTDGGALARARQ